MEKTNTNPLSKYFFLSGERLERAKRVYRQDTVLVFLSSIATFLLAQRYPNLDSILWSGYVSAVLIGSLIRISRGETFFQFRLMEVHYTKKQADKALEELHEFASSVQKGGNGVK